MADLRKETLFSFNQLRKKLPTHPAYATLYRWYREGIPSRETKDIVRLEALQVGGSLRSSVEAYDRFIARLNGFVPAE